MTSRLNRRYLAAVLAVASLAVAGTAVAVSAQQDPAAAPPGDIFPGVQRARDAARGAADKLPVVAARNGKSEAEVRRLADDDTVWLDRKGRIFFVEPSAAQAPANGAPAEPAPYPYNQTFQLHSKAGSSRVLYLDFVGASITGTAWNANFSVPAGFSAGPFDLDGNPGAFSNAEMDLIQSVFQRVSEDYAPFDIDVTTQDPGTTAIDRTDATDQNYGVTALITSSSQLATYTCPTGCGGIAYIGVSDLYAAPGHQYYQPALVFQSGLGGTGTNAKLIAEAASHEVGHNFGLSHDGTTTGASYYEGHADWAPIMGVGYYKPVVQWSKGEYTNANNTEDDIAVIAAHGGALRADDVGDSIATATLLGAGANKTTNSIIGTDLDVDVYAFDGSSTTTITVTPAPTSPNLDARVTLYSSGGAVLGQSDPPSAATTNNDVATGLDAAITTTLAAGRYYVAVEGVGTGSGTTGYTGYGSIGRYTLTVTTTVAAPTVAASPSTVNAGASVTAGWSGIPSPTSTDWIGLYPTSGAADGSFVAWRYTNGTASGSVPFTVPATAPAGTTYELRLFSNNSYTRLATSGPITVTRATLSATPATVNAGNAVTATWSNVANPTTTDWIGLYANSGAADGSFVAWRYTNGTASGSVPFTVPATAPAGTTYELRLFTSDSYSRLAASTAISVAKATIAASPATVNAGSAMTATWSNLANPSATDWIGLYANSGASDGSLIAWRYTSGTASGNVAFLLPANLAAGTTYELRLFTNDSYVKVATSAPFTVSVATLTRSASTVARGGTVNATWSNVANPTAKDWIGLYATNGAGDGSFVAWRYTTGTASGTVPFTIPANAVPGTTYELRLFTNDSFVRVATSSTFAVT